MSLIPDFRAFLRHTERVPWSPSNTQLLVDPRLDRYRGRVAVLIQSGHLVGHLLVTAEYVADQTGGHGWWRRWSDFQEVAALHLRYLDHASSLLWVDGPDLTTELEHWGLRRLHGAPEGLSLRWLSRAESRESARTVFGLIVDAHGRAVDLRAPAGLGGDWVPWLIPTSTAAPARPPALVPSLCAAASC